MCICACVCVHILVLAIMYMWRSEFRQPPGVVLSSVMLAWGLNLGCQAQWLSHVAFLASPCAVALIKPSSRWRANSGSNVGQLDLALPSIITAVPLCAELESHGSGFPGFICYKEWVICGSHEFLKNQFFPLRERFLQADSLSLHSLLSSILVFYYFS